MRQGAGGKKRGEVEGEMCGREWLMGGRKVVEMVSVGSFLIAMIGDGRGGREET